MAKLWSKVWKKLLGATVVIAVLMVYFALTKEEDSFEAKYVGATLNTEVEGLGRSNTYTKYLERHTGTKKATSTIDIDIFNYSYAEGVEMLSDFEGVEKVLKTEENSILEYRITVKEAGMYQAYLEYFPLKSRGTDIERCIYLNGEIPFLGAETITFSRIWGDMEGGVKKDNQGNDIRPSQVEKPRWESSYFKDFMGYYTEPYYFYLEAGENTIRLEGVNEPMAIRSFCFQNSESSRDYQTFLSKYDLTQFQNTDNTYLDVIQGEDALYRSSPSLYAIFDRSSSKTDPSSTAKIRLNMIGGGAWKVVGQWIEWEVEAPEDGLYRISVKARQNYNRGFVSNRILYLDNEIPFEGVSVIPFRYSNEWTLYTLQDENGEDYLFPLTKGIHKIRFEVTLGELGDILTRMEESIFRLNEIYRKILVLTGPEPDKYRDYRIDKVYPEVITAMDLESKILYKIVDDLTNYSGERGAQAGSALTLAKQLENFVKKPEKIPLALTNYKENISSLGNSMITLSEGSLDVDYIILSAKDATLPTVNESFAEKALHEAKSFGSSFVEDYNNLGNVYDKDTAIEVWMLSGRDQSTILKTMIDDTFTPNTGIAVNVKLIAAEALMPAVVAGTGPDVALSVNQGDPVNYALRNAVVDISKLDGYKELAAQYSESSLIPFHYQDGVFGIPETLNFNVMFYRKDILEELGVEIPNTWDDLIKILPTIQKKNMNVGIPSIERKINNVLYPDLSNFFAQLYQRNGTLYNEDGSKTLLDGQLAVEAFETYTRFFTHHKTPIVYDFVNRFRTGEMPIGFVDYNNFNTLVVFAPEIRGLWDFTLLPGTKVEDGTINRSTSGWGVASMVLKTEKQDASWEFFKWWCSAETQARFGRELESVMGASARYATANRTAFEQLSWSAANAVVLRQQWDSVVGTPEVPGGYYTSRHIINAVRKVINNSEDTRETLLDYTRTINNEITKKRKEFGLEK
ncbi:extracellular solute-binding protein [Lachnoclostridium sp.]|uniref:extracellular solute-binding protein n=1 Tax=Lachnoclostridium sp. TaxID=2028282 RepID=UPI00289A8B84|nr:extracellular solute-binding protein [Lachnoclostridium sp.]